MQVAVLVSVSNKGGMMTAVDILGVVRRIDDWNERQHVTHWNSQYGLHAACCVFQELSDLPNICVPATEEAPPAVSDEVFLAKMKEHEKIDKMMNATVCGFCGKVEERDQAILDGWEPYWWYKVGEEWKNQ